MLLDFLRDVKISFASVVLVHNGCSENVSSHVSAKNDVTIFNPAVKAKSTEFEEVQRKSHPIFQISFHKLAFLKGFSGLKIT